jgi:transposase
MLGAASCVVGDLWTEATVAHVLVSKYADHLPLYRQAQIYERQGVNFDPGGAGGQRPANFGPI